MALHLSAKSCAEHPMGAPSLRTTLLWGWGMAIVKEERKAARRVILKKEEGKGMASSEYRRDDGPIPGSRVLGEKSSFGRMGEVAKKGCL